MKNFFTTNIWLKLASLVLATTLWFFVMVSGRSEVTLDVPIEFTNVPPALEVMDSPKTVSVRMEGQERLMKNFRKNDIRASIDLSSFKTGKSFYTLSKNDISVPKTMSVTSIDPETISLKIEEQMKKTVKVKPKVVGLPEKGYAIAEIKVVPETISLEGPKSVIAKIHAVKTEPINIIGINTDLTYRANLNLSDDNIRKSINKVDVNISVKKIQ
jgi:YbbR domain-containing protein